MAGVPWIKLTTSVFDDEKMALIDGMPDRDSILVIWFKLLCMAGRLNNSGVFMLNENFAYTDEMLATIFRRPIDIVRAALETFERLGMVKTENGVYTLPNWEKHQSLDKLEAAKEKNRQRVAAHREKQKQLAGCNAYSNVTNHYTVMPCNALDIDKDRDKDIDIDIDTSSVEKCQTIIDLFNSICKSLPAVRKITTARESAIMERLQKFGLGDFQSCFEKAEASSFLKGKSESGWRASFDWLITEENMVKVLEGIYEDRPSRKGKQEIVPDWMKKRQLDPDELAAIDRIVQDEADPEMQAQIESLQKRLQEKYGGKNNA